MSPWKALRSWLINSQQDDLLEEVRDLKIQVSTLQRENRLLATIIEGQIMRVRKGLLKDANNVALLESELEHGPPA